MRFRVKSVRKGYCEVWANEHDGGRYQKLAVIVRDEGMWSWHAKEHEPPFDMPFYTYEFETRRECIVNCMRTALKRLVEHAIEQQPHESPHWHSPRMDALCEVCRSRLFTLKEEGEIEKRLVTFE